MVQKGFVLTRKQAINIFLVLSQARIKLTGKYKAQAQREWEEFAKVLDLDLNNKELKLLI